MAVVDPEKIFGKKPDKNKVREIRQEDNDPYNNPRPTGRVLPNNAAKPKP